MRPFVDPPRRELREEYDAYWQRVHAEQHPPRLTGIPLAIAISAPVWILILLAAWKWA